MHRHLTDQGTLGGEILAAVAAVLRQLAAVALQLCTTCSRTCGAIGLYTAAAVALQARRRIQTKQPLDSSPHPLVSVGEDEWRTEIGQQDHEDGQLGGSAKVGSRQSRLQKYQQSEGQVRDHKHHHHQDADAGGSRLLTVFE